MKGTGTRVTSDDHVIKQNRRFHSGIHFHNRTTYNKPIKSIVCFYNGIMKNHIHLSFPGCCRSYLIIGKNIHSPGAHNFKDPYPTHISSKKMMCLFVEYWLIRSYWRRFKHYIQTE